MSIETSNKQSTAVTLLVPMLALGLPVIELTLTTLRRLLREVRIVSKEPGRSRYEFLIKGRATLFAADKDHIHHRLLALGISHRNAVLLLYSACLVADAIALALVVRVGPNYLILLGAGAIAALAAIRRLDYSELQPLRNGMLLPLFSLRLLTQGGLQVACDLAFSGLSLLFALVLRAGWPLDDFHRMAFLHHAPVLAGVQIGAFALCGVYARSYRYAGLGDLLILLRGLALASVGTWLVMQVTDFGSYPGVAVITLDLYFFASLAMLARFSFDLLDYQFQSNQGRKSRVLICGAQQAGLLVVKDILSNPALDMKIVGFLDDDSSTRNFCGFSVFHTEALNDLITQRLFDEIVLTADKLSEKSLRALATRCRLADIRIRRFSVAWSEVDPARLGEPGSPDRRLAEPVRQLS